jgi:hypothetical protein
LNVWPDRAKGHEIRNVAEYEGELTIDERLVADMITACRVVDCLSGSLSRTPRFPRESDRLPEPYTYMAYCMD